MNKYLFVGYGSITKKHIYVLQNTLKNDFQYKIISSHYRHRSLSTSWNDIKKKTYDPDVIVICSVTDHHFIHLQKINEIFTDKVILVEKPLFNRVKYINLKNKVFVNYNLRFSPIINLLKSKKSFKSLLKVNCVCKSNLKYWRKSKSYKSTSTAKGSNGSLIYEMSHELDYLMLIFKKLSPFFYFSKKISQLKIKFDDHLNVLFKSTKLLINLEIDFISSLNQRYVELIYENKTEIYDIINGNLKTFKKNLLVSNKKFGKLDILKTIEITHNLIIDKKYEPLCTFDEAIRLLKLIESIKDKKRI